MGVFYRAGEFIGGISKELVDKIGSVTLTTTAKDLSGAVNELNSGKANKATTLLGYGIADAKIENGTIILGSNTITPLTSHQDISGKADKATTLAGYGITDAKISNGTITLGSNSITPLTSHQDISGKVNKSGDTMTGSLSVNGDITTNTSLFTIKNSNVTLGTTSNNGVTANQYRYFRVLDNASQYLTWFSSYQNTSGYTETGMNVRNKKTDGTQVDNNFTIGVNKDGTRVYSCADKAKFRSDMGITPANIDAATSGHNHDSTYLKLSGGTLTGNTYVKRASGESQLGATNTASGKSVYLYAVDSGTVGVYSNIGATLISMDTSKKVYFNGTTYSIGNAANFRSALGLGDMATQSTSRLILWKMNSRTNVTQTATDDYWTIGQFPAKSGYTRYVMQIQLNNRAVVASYYTLESNNDIRVYTRKLSGNSQTFSIDVICVYLPDANKTT